MCVSRAALGLCPPKGCLGLWEMKMGICKVIYMLVPRVFFASLVMMNRRVSSLCILRLLKAHTRIDVRAPIHTHTHIDKYTINTQTDRGWNSTCSHSSQRQKPPRKGQEGPEMEIGLKWLRRIQKNTQVASSPRTHTHSFIHTTRRG